MKAAFHTLAQKYPGIALKESVHGWEVMIPEPLVKGHERLFAKVMQQFLVYVTSGKMPAWEIPGMLAKYYTTTRALAIAKRLE
jgi:hypothetical protein